MTRHITRRTAAAAAALGSLVSVTACQSPAGGPAGQPANAAVRPVSTTLPADSPVADPGAITDRFANVIWPAVVDYHYHRTQNGSAERQWLTVIDSGLDQAGWGALRQAVYDLGELTPDGPTRTSAGVEALQLRSARVDAAADANATVTACYTFTALSYTMESGYDPVRTPAAAEADFALVRTDNWDLHAISDQRQVTGC